ncbi:hypothetical protein CEXT_148231 [Caerostris extrusa]|uniref:Uncharacterized protein n=1 Tax=Caerostris extrusa TaxID=172846 RepID=A0AAV4S670_CAEEX|nr:hypothetical protein CEXT_148231 [Caerostris extrusa]
MGKLIIALAPHARLGGAALFLWEKKPLGQFSVETRTRKFHLLCKFYAFIHNFLLILGPDIHDFLVSDFLTFLLTFPGSYHPGPFILGMKMS